MYDVISNTHLVNKIHEPTRITNSSRTLIDPIFTSEHIDVTESGTLNVEARLSDHKATYVCVTMNYKINRSYKRNVWRYKDADFDKLNKLINDCDWRNIISNAENVNIATEHFTSQYLKLVRECIPEKSVTIRPKDKPWFDSTLRKTIRIRNRLRNKALKTKNESDWINYRKHRNKVNNMKKHALCNYYDSIDLQLSDASSNNNNKLYWKLIKDAFHAKPTKDIPPIQYTSDTGGFNIAFTDTEKVDVLNKYFSSVSNVDDSLSQLPQLYHICNDKLNNVTIEEQEVIDIIKILPVNKAIGPDAISHKMLKSTLQSVAKPLCLFFNKPLNENVYPNNWKIAHVLPLFKRSFCINKLQTSITLELC